MEVQKYVVLQNTSTEDRAMQRCNLSAGEGTAMVAVVKKQHSIDL